MNEMNWIQRLFLFVTLCAERWNGIRVGNLAISGRGYIRKEWDLGWEIRFVGPRYFRKSRLYKERRPFILYKKNVKVEGGEK